jgi:hypothetical protein
MHNTRFSKYVVVVLFAAIMLLSNALLLTTPVHASQVRIIGTKEGVDNFPLFELDANTASNGGTDWETLFDASGNVITPLPANAISAVFLNDHVSPDLTTFTQGSKDTQVPNVDWVCTSQSSVSPAKDDVINTYAVAFRAPSTKSPISAGDLIIYMGLERSVNNGDSNLGFWIFQDPNVSCTANGSNVQFTGVHTVGDILVQLTLTGGGAVSNFQVFEWTGNPSDDYENLHVLTAAAMCDGSGQLVCGVNNVASFTPAWDTTALDSNEFFEMGLDITQLVGIGNFNTCATTFLTDTRTSQTPTAALADFARGELSVCAGLTVIKNSLGGTQVFSFHGTGTPDQNGLPTDFQLDTSPSGSASTTFDNILPANTYSITEDVPAGWQFVSASCDDGYSTPTTHGVTGIQLSEGQSATCTFTDQFIPPIPEYSFGVILILFAFVGIYLLMRRKVR